VPAAPGLDIAGKDLARGSRDFMSIVYRAIGRARHRAAAGSGQQVDVDAVPGSEVVPRLADQARRIHID
jgi:hypothetical protein